MSALRAGAGPQADDLGDHSLSCGIGTEEIARHNQVQDVLFKVAQQAGLAPVREAIGLLTGSENRPSEVLLRGGRWVAIPAWTTLPPMHARQPPHCDSKSKLPKPLHPHFG